MQPEKREVASSAYTGKSWIHARFLAFPPNSQTPNAFALAKLDNSGYQLILWAILLAIHLGRGNTMPLYEYQCSGCEKVHEIQQKFSDAPMVECPDCGKPVKKLISLSSFALKGTGFYKTDYAAPAPAPAPAPCGEG